MISFNTFDKFEYNLSSLDTNGTETALGYQLLQVPILSAADWVDLVGRYSVGPVSYLNSTSHNRRCLDRNGTALSPTLPLCSRALGESGRQHSAISVKARTIMSCRIQVGYGSYAVVTI